MNKKLVNEMIEKIEDPKARKFYEDIANGVMQSQIKCMGETCNGRVVGFVMLDGQVIEKSNEDYQVVGPKWGITTSRMRIDGVRGFQCACGNSSLLAPEDEGIIGIQRPTIEDLDRIAEKIKKRSKSYKEKRFIVEGIN